MKVAIPMMKERVAPYFGASPKILIVDIEDMSIRRETQLDVGNMETLEIVHHLLDFGVEKIICGV